MLVLALPIVLGPAAGSADAASCKVMTVGYAFSSGSVIALEPTHQDIAFQGCVQFTNNLDLGVTITVAGGYSVTLGPKESTPPKKAYVGTAAGRHNVTARSGPSSADGSISVAAPPASPKSPSKSPTHRATPKHTTPPQPTTAHPSSTSTGPRVAPVPPTVGAHIPKRRQQSPPGPAPSVAPTTP